MLLNTLVGVSQTTHNSYVDSKGHTHFSSNFKLNPEEFYKEFVKLLDSVRNAKLVEKWFVYHTKLDSLGSLACKHHNKYMMNMTSKNWDDVFLSHTEKKVGYETKEHTNWTTNVITTTIDTFVYKSNDTLIDSFSKRCEYYSKGQFSTYGECCTGGYLTIQMDNYSNKDFAKMILKNFKKSKPHWDILTMYEYTDIAINLMTDKYNTKYWITINVGRNKSTEYMYLYNSPKSEITKNKGFINKIKNYFK